MAVFSYRGLSGAIDATAGQIVGCLWNPDAAKQLKLLEAGFYKFDIPSNRFALVLAKTRGTPGSTVTPTATNCWDSDDVAAASIALIDLGSYTVLPTPGNPRLFSTFLPTQTGSAGSGHVFVPQRPIYIRPGTGVGIEQTAAVGTDLCEIYFVWEEV